MLDESLNQFKLDLTRFQHFLFSMMLEDLFKCTKH